MKLFSSLFLFVLFFSTSIYAQKTISGKSQPMRFKIETEYKRGIPPNLYISLSFEDSNNNGILEADESAKLLVSITNKGKGPAYGLKILVNDNSTDLALKITDVAEIPLLNPEKTTVVNIPIKAERGIKSAEHKLEISIKEHFGYDMDPAFLVLNTFEFQKPDLVFSGLEIEDSGEGTAALVADGKLQAGEQVKVKMVIQNTGQNVAKNTRYKISTDDANIYLAGNEGVLGDIAVGEVKEFWMTLSPNKRVTTTKDLPIKLTMNNDFNQGEIINMALPISLNQKPQTPQIVSVKANMASLTKQIARFEYNSNKITANVGNVIDINQVVHSKTVRPNSVAVLIGIEEYSSFVPAPYAMNDAKIFETYCKNVLGISKVYTYTNKEVSGFFFEDKFNPVYGELQKAVVKGETEVFVFYSGHGIPSKDGEQIYLFPSDGRLEALAERGYDLNKFYENLNQLKAKSVTVFIDACFSGASRATENIKTENLVAMKGVRIKPKLEQPWEINPEFTVFTSCGFSETSLGFDPSKTGLFTYFLCAGLQGKADANGDKKITAEELANYISENVKQTSQKILGLQSPQFYGNKTEVLSEY